MTVEQGIERLAALVFIVTGLSHVAAPRAWIRFFLDMRARGETAGLYNAYVHGPLGFLIVAFHPVWNGPGLVVTLLGWALAVKGTLYWLWPGLAQKTMARLGEERAWEFQVAGAASVVLGLVIGWIAMGGLER